MPGPKNNKDTKKQAKKVEKVVEEDPEEVVEDAVGDDNASEGNGMNELVDPDEPASFDTDEGVDISRLYFKATLPKSIDIQLKAYPKYIYDPNMPLTADNFEKHGKNMIMVTEEIKMTKGPLPRHDKSYHREDPNTMERAWFYIARNETSEKFFESIQKIDDYLDTEINQNQNKNKILCVLNEDKKRMKLGGITYKRMITTAGPGNSLTLGDDDDEPDTKKGKKGQAQKKETKAFEPWDRVRVKLSTVYDENKSGKEDIRDIDTQVYIGKNESPLENAKTITDIEKYFSWNCTARFAIMFNKMWIAKTGKKECGMGLKCIQIGITKTSDFTKSVPISQQLKKRLFATPTVDATSAEDDENNTTSSKAGSTSTKTPAKSTASAKSVTAPAKGTPSKATPSKGTPAKPVAKTPAKSTKNAKNNKQDAEENNDEDNNDEEVNEEENNEEENNEEENNEEENNEEENNEEDAEDENNDEEGNEEGEEDAEDENNEEGEENNEEVSEPEDEPEPAPAPKKGKTVVKAVANDVKVKGKTTPVVAPAKKVVPKKNK
jgi:hypothetical protein